MSSDQDKLDPPLLGLRVVEFVGGPMLVAGRTLADFGADVLLIETAAAGGVTTSALSREAIEQQAWNRGKRRLRLNLAIRADRDRLIDEIAGCDILIEDGSFPTTIDSRFSASALEASYPSLIFLSVSDFGRTGAQAGWRATDPVLHALSAGLCRSGLSDHPPLLPPDAIATQSAAAQAVFVALLAFIRRLDKGDGDHLDFSILDGVVQTLDPGFGVGGSAAAGARGADLPRGRPKAQNQYPIISCADGFVRLCILSPRQWRGMFEWMGSPEEFADPSFAKLATRFASPTLIPAITRFFAGKSGAQLEVEGQAFGVPAAAVLAPNDAVDTEQNEARQFYETVRVNGTSVRLPGSPVEIDGTRLGRRGEAAEQRTGAADPRSALFRQPPLRTKGGVGGPLQGVRVLDLGVIVVGAETGRLLADAGADVVKVENGAFPDGMRQTRDGSVMSPSFAAGHRNKRSLGLDLRHEEGKRLFLGLVAQADVLLSNFKPGTLASLGFDAGTLLSANPRLIAIDSSAFGPNGPKSRRLGYGPLVRAATGLSNLWSYPDEPGSFSDAMTVYPDHVASRLGAIAALALLIRRRRNERGGTASIAQAEIILDHLGVDMAVAALGRAGEDVADKVPCGPRSVYPCAGEDEWCVVTAETDEQCVALAAVIGLGLPGNGQSVEAPKWSSGELDVALRAWLTGQSPHSAMAALQAAGVPAGAMLRVGDMPAFEHFSVRRFFRFISNPALRSPFLVEARPVCASHLPDPGNAPAPLMGQDGVAIVRDWLHLPDHQIAELVRTQVISGVPDSSNFESQAT
jgi:crotonobetainyl-CoA:carnitine CoA-transferase CaiB-like acyl-CoA transferase